MLGIVVVALLARASPAAAQVDPIAPVTVTARLRTPADDVHLYRASEGGWSDVCLLPCDLTELPGQWRLALGHPDGDPTAIDDHVVRVDGSGTLDLTYADRIVANGVGALLIAVGAIAAGVGAILLATGARPCPTDLGGALECSLNNSLMIVGGGFGAVMGPLLIGTGIVLVALEPRASARWLPPED